MASKDLVAASSTPIVLGILARGESYGYDIIQQVKTASGGKLEWTDGMLYPVLHRLEDRGLIHSRWGVSENGRKRKYYRLEKEGRARLIEEKEKWKMVNSTLTRVWRAAHV